MLKSSAKMLLKTLEQLNEYQYKIKDIFLCLEYLSPKLKDQQITDALCALKFHLKSKKFKY
jgi:2C-methyl-D-erythritol 2,4-cyclodiphosphate synthase